MTHKDIEVAFREARKNIDSACTYLSFLFDDIPEMGLDPVKQAGLIDAVKAKIDYLKGLALNANTHPWVEL